VSQPLGYQGRIHGPGTVPCAGILVILGAYALCQRASLPRSEPPAAGARRVARGCPLLLGASYWDSPTLSRSAGPTSPPLPSGRPALGRLSQQAARGAPLPWRGEAPQCVASKANNNNGHTGNAGKINAGPPLDPPAGGFTEQGVATSALCECGSGAPRRRAPRGLSSGPCCRVIPGRGEKTPQKTRPADRHGPVRAEGHTLGSQPL
jgi:hypothetical protein